MDQREKRQTIFKIKSMKFGKKLLNLTFHNVLSRN